MTAAVSVQLRRLKLWNSKVDMMDFLALTHSSDSPIEENECMIM
jgi:hypothetical protein